MSNFKKKKKRRAPRKKKEPDANKKLLLLSLDKELFIEAKKILFRNSMSIQQYFSFLLHNLILSDEKSVALLQEAKEHKLLTSKILKSDKKYIKDDTSDYLYDMIELERKKENEKDI